MSDFENFLFEFESSLENITTEPKKKTKKKKKKKKGLKQKDKMTEKTSNEERRRRRKKKSCFKTAMEARKEKKKEKKKKVKLDAGSSLRPDETIEPEKLRKKKKVLFDLPHSCFRVKRPKFSSSLPRGAETQEGAETQRGAETQEGVGTQGGWLRGAELDSQSSDVHSQDLFITQKTFRVSPPAPPASLTPTTSPEVKGHRREERRSLDARRSRNQNPFLDEPVVVEPSRRDASTQTENFFTSELPFRRAGPPPAEEGEELQPLDLSLPHKVRGHRPGPCKEEEEEEEGAEPGKRGAATAVRGGWVEATGGAESTPSPRSESENKSGETATSSEDGELYGRIGIVTQVRTVQMRLNESFFFKTKGDAHSPRPESPLMKLAQGRRDVKRRKSR